MPMIVAELHGKRLNVSYSHFQATGMIALHYAKPEDGGAPIDLDAITFNDRAHLRSQCRQDAEANLDHDPAKTAQMHRAARDFFRGV